MYFTPIQINTKNIPHFEKEDLRDSVGLNGSEGGLMIYDELHQEVSY